MAKIKIFPGFLIDPVERTITAVEYQDDLAFLYKMLNVEIIEHVTFDYHGNYLVVDEEGLLKPAQAFFKIKGFHSPLAGRGLVCGPRNRKGRIPTVDLVWLETNVRFAIPIKNRDSIEVVQLSGVTPKNFAEKLRTATVHTLNKADIERCPFAIFMPEHYRENGDCKCDNAEHRAMMIAEWGYTEDSFKDIPLKD